MRTPGPTYVLIDGAHRACVSLTYLRIENGKYRACVLVDGRRTVDLPLEPFETAREACLFADIHDGRIDLAAEIEAQSHLDSTPDHAPDTTEHPKDHDHVFVRHARFADLVMTDGAAARTWMQCLHCPERREIVP